MFSRDNTPMTGQPELNGHRNVAFGRRLRLFQLTLRAFRFAVKISIDAVRLLRVPLW
jgi:hypothetical protein